MTARIMAEEEDEVDILGDSDYNLDSLLVKDDGRLSSCYVGGVLGSQGAELLNCDYNIGSHWLLDAPNQWYTSSDDSKPFERSQFGYTTSLGNGISDSLPSTSHCNENDCWSEKEKSLLEQGLEMFGQSWIQLAQFIGSKTSQQVKTYVTCQNIHLSNTNENFNFDTTTHCNSEVFSFSELIDDMQIPASMEEVIAVVSTAKPTVPLPKKNICSTSVVAKDNCYPVERVKRKDMHDKSKSRRGRAPFPKHPSDKKSMVKNSCLSVKKTKVDQNLSSVIKLSSGEEVIRMKKESCLDSDEDAEIEVDDGDFSNKHNKLLNDSELTIAKEDSKNIWLQSDFYPEKKVGLEIMNNDNSTTLDSNVTKIKEKSSSGVTEENIRSGHTHHDVLELIFNMPPPVKEVTLDPDVITDEERGIHVEFFDGRSVKTPKRYLKIRNHILDCWRQSRPSYVTKTSVRNGLKHCGDVNCIGRIHAYLEQIGAINFGCEQARYLNMSSTLPAVTNQKKFAKDEVSGVQTSRIGAMRPRKKKQNLPFALDGDGGYTITHSESGEAIHTTVVQDSSSKGSKGHASKSKTIKLIYCRKYSDSKPAPFAVSMSVEALLVIDVHAHSSHTEVAGLLGGTYDIDNGILHIQRAVACRSNSSGVHCDMCPVSQTEASEKLQNNGLEVIGWYHSHPTFLPNPSLQDLATQKSIQQWFSQTTATPIVSFILSPYCPISPTVASQYRCLTVHSDEVETSPHGTPYTFPVSVSSKGLNVANMLKDMSAIFSLVEENQHAAVDFNSEFRHNNELSYKQKCVESAKLHLASSKPEVPVQLQNSVLQGIMQACNTLALARKSNQSAND